MLDVWGSLHQSSPFPLDPFGHGDRLLSQIELFKGQVISGLHKPKEASRELKPKG